MNSYETMYECRCSSCECIKLNLLLWFVSNEEKNGTTFKCQMNKAYARFNRPTFSTHSLPSRNKLFHKTFALSIEKFAKKMISQQVNSVHVYVCVRSCVNVLKPLVWTDEKLIGNGIPTRYFSSFSISSVSFVKISFGTK